MPALRRPTRRLSHAAVSVRIGPVLLPHTAPRGCAWPYAGLARALPSYRAGGPLGRTHAIAGVSTSAPIRPPEPRTAGRFAPQAPPLLHPPAPVHGGSPGEKSARCLEHNRNIVKRKLSLKGSADRKSTRLNSSHANISYAVFCLKKKNS